MPDLINGKLLTFPGIEAVWSIENQAAFHTDVLIGMNNARGDHYEQWRVNASKKRLHDTITGRVGPGVPQANLKIGWTNETETVRLFPMFMGSTGDARLGQGKIRHYGSRGITQFILSV